MVSAASWWPVHMACLQFSSFTDIITGSASNVVCAISSLYCFHICHLYFLLTLLLACVTLVSLLTPCNMFLPCMKMTPMMIMTNAWLCTIIVCANITIYILYSVLHIYASTLWAWPKLVHTLCLIGYYYSYGCTTSSAHNDYYMPQTVLNWEI